MWKQADHNGQQISRPSSLPRHTAMLVSPWLLVGSAIILGLAITFWAFKNAQQERENMAANLQARAGALMWAVEGSARAGMGMMRTASYMQFMLEEISRQADIEYIAVITPDGRIIAHSDPARIGDTLYKDKKLAELRPYQQIHWRIIRGKNGGKLFEAYRRFVPLPGFFDRLGGHMRGRHDAMPMMRGKMRGFTPPGLLPGEPPEPFFPDQRPTPPSAPQMNAQPDDAQALGQNRQNTPPPAQGFGPARPGEFGGARSEPGKFGGGEPQPPMPRMLPGNEPVIVIGLEMSSLEIRLTAAERNTLFTALLVGLLGLGAFLSLFWAQNYKLSRRMLMDTRAFAEEVVSSMPLGLVIADARGRVAQANALAGKLLGLKPEKLAGLALKNLPGFNWPGLAERAAKGESVLEEEYTLSTPLDLPTSSSTRVSTGPGAPVAPGTPDANSTPGATDAPSGADAGDSEDATIPVSVSASRIINEEGASLGILFLLRDTREVKRLQAELRRSERLSTLGNMAARVAHEIRNPLSSIKGFATYLGTRQNDESDKQAAKTMIGEVDRLNRVVSELLDFARPSNLHLAPQNVSALIDRAVRLAGMDAETKGVRLHAQSPESSSSLMVLADAERITQALLNLLLNAVQATPEGGSVTISAGRTNRADSIAIRIADTGQGMEPDVLAQVCNPYFTTKASGTGLGLSIVSKIVEDHQGTLTLASTPGEGTTVTLRLPPYQE